MTFRFNGHAGGDALDAMDAEIKAEVEEAVKFAFDNPLTDPSEIKRDVYAEVA